MRGGSLNQPNIYQLPFDVENMMVALVKGSRMITGGKGAGKNQRGTVCKIVQKKRGLVRKDCCLVLGLEKKEFIFKQRRFLIDSPSNPFKLPVLCQDRQVSGGNPCIHQVCGADNAILRLEDLMNLVKAGSFFVCIYTDIILIICINTNLISNPHYSTIKK